MSLEVEPRIREIRRKWFLKLEKEFTQVKQLKTAPILPKKSDFVQGMAVESRFPAVPDSLCTANPKTQAESTCKCS